ncbi:MAG: hypothetical protein UU80_C0025G0017, partial [candidate division WWE3 bacterium GW2011_GWA1_41_8]
KLCIETRAWVDGTKDIEEKLSQLGAKYIKTLYIEDEFYADLSDFDIKQHTFEQSKKAARIRTTTDKDNKQSLLVQIREVPKDSPPELKLHDLTKTVFEKLGNIEEKNEFVEELKKRGFDSLVTKISKDRKVYSLENDCFYIDDINGYSKALEIKTFLPEINNSKNVKKLHKKLIKKLGIPEDDLIEKSHTHLIIDSFFKSQPHLKSDLLKKKLSDLIKEKEELMLESEECFREGGDGWHDNARWDILRENIDVISIRIAKLKEEIFEINRS